MMERLASISYPPSIGRFSEQQIAQRSTWGVVPDEDMEWYALHRIAVRPLNASTCTYVNPLDPDPNRGWLENDDKATGTLFPAGRF